MRVRIPGWAQDAPVPTDLYSFTDKAQAYSISVNGSKVNAKQYDGYATLVRNWKAGDVVEIKMCIRDRTYTDQQIIFIVKRIAHTCKETDQRILVLITAHASLRVSTMVSRKV